jgi:hypothetical protein
MSLIALPESSQAELMLFADQRPGNGSNFVLFAEGAVIPVIPLSRAKMGGFLERLHGTAFVTQIWQNATNLQNASDRHRFFEGKNGAPTTLSGF